ncbi:vacuolar protein sorting-associated protein 37A [Sitophilus oryzae]|uniref:Vacuolar protein sorting-associated protein 37A n=1 Tax=Sitophilus oryzae TaxID=7048 RepID=A0A6J2XJP2_SITOR|nr:vacuolar protein sorting-associated protein 37A [Sitophilus oryzae]
MIPLFYNREAENRKRQITTLKIFNDNVIEIVSDLEYEIPFQCGGDKLTLKISLSHDFPVEKPVLSVSPMVYHPWVNENGVITSAPGLINFSVHSDLGRVVQAIIRDFQRNPPRLAANNNVISSNIPILGSADNRGSPNFQSRSSLSPPNDPTGQYQRKNNTASPFLDLNNLTVEELKFLNENDDRLMEFIEDIPPMRDQQKALDDLLVGIEELAEENLNKEEQIETLKEAVDSRIEEVNKLAFNNEKLYNVYQSLSEKYSPRNIQEELRKSAKEAEDESDKIADSFLQGDLDVDTFLNMFIKSKSLCQLRKTKEEKLCHQLDRLEKAGF